MTGWIGHGRTTCTSSTCTAARWIYTDGSDESSTRSREEKRIVALDCVEIDGVAPLSDVVAAQDLADRIAAMLTKLIRSAQADPAQLAG